ncbi:MAG: exo-alpha-sialidase [Prolixibacteraceae bacterium]|nr:exo-alpha-sialidase [Prolixibacteraceae bacterium]
MRFICLILFVFLSVVIFAQHYVVLSAFGNRSLDEIENAKPPVYLGEPSSNEGTNLLNDIDGSIKFIYRQGDWDHGGFSDEVYFKTTTDEGQTWTEPQILGNTGPGKQCFATINPVTGEVIIFFIHSEKGQKGNYRYVRSEKGRTDWTYNHHFDSVRFGGMGYGNCLWIDMPDKKKRVLCGVHGNNAGAGCYFSDDDGRTWKPSNRAKVPNLIPNIWQTGSVEPSFIELNDGRIWMLMRNSNDHLWESFSEDKGETWSEAVPTQFKCGPNSWVTTKRLSTGEILLVWNNAMSMHPSVTQDKWSFTNRDVIHVAISSDEGKTWHGFRELWLDEMRDSSQFVNHPGDKGQNESKVAETPEGNILVACGQAPGHRAFLLLDPNWIYQKSASEDFSNGLDYWSSHKLLVRSPIYSRWYHYRYNRKKGAELIPHPTNPEKQVLKIRREADSTVYSQRDCAVWNFPSGRAGTFETKIYLNKKFRGGMIVLTDRWYQPTDTQGEEMAMFSLDIPAGGGVEKEFVLEKEKWYTVTFSWNLETENSCEVEIDGKKLSSKLPLLNPNENGISYVRFRSSSVWPDNEGFLIESVKAEVK